MLESHRMTAAMFGAVAMLNTPIRQESPPANPRKMISRDERNERKAKKKQASESRRRNRK